MIITDESITGSHVIWILCWSIRQISDPQSFLCNIETFAFCCTAYLNFYLILFIPFTALNMINSSQTLTYPLKKGAIWNLWGSNLSPRSTSRREQQPTSRKLGWLTMQSPDVQQLLCNGLKFFVTFSTPFDRPSFFDFVPTVNNYTSCLLPPWTLFGRPRRWRRHEAKAKCTQNQALRKKNRDDVRNPHSTSISTKRFRAQIQRPVTLKWN